VWGLIIDNYGIAFFHLPHDIIDFRVQSGFHKSIIRAVTGDKFFDDPVQGCPNSANEPR